MFLVLNLCFRLYFCLLKSWCLCLQPIDEIEVVNPFVKINNVPLRNFSLLCISCYYFLDFSLSSTSFHRNFFSEKSPKKIEQLFSKRINYMEDMRNIFSIFGIQLLTIVLINTLKKVFDGPIFSIMPYSVIKKTGKYYVFVFKTRLLWCRWLSTSISVSVDRYASLVSYPIMISATQFLS